MSRMRSRTRSARSVTAGLGLEDLLERARTDGQRRRRARPQAVEHDAEVPAPDLRGVAACRLARAARAGGEQGEIGPGHVLAQHAGGLRRLDDRLQPAEELDVARVQVLVAAD